MKLKLFTVDKDNKILLKIWVLLTLYSHGTAGRWIAQNLYKVWKCHLWSKENTRVHYLFPVRQLYLLLGKKKKLKAHTEMAHVEFWKEQQTLFEGGDRPYCCETYSHNANALELRFPALYTRGACKPRASKLLGVPFWIGINGKESAVHVCFNANIVYKGTQHSSKLDSEQTHKGWLASTDTASKPISIRPHFRWQHDWDQYCLCGFYVMDCSTNSNDCVSVSPFCFPSDSLGYCMMSQFAQATNLFCGKLSFLDML